MQRDGEGPAGAAPLRAEPGGCGDEADAGKSEAAPAESVEKAALGKFEAEEAAATLVGVTEVSVAERAG